MNEEKKSQNSTDIVSKSYSVQIKYGMSFFQ